MLAKKAILELRTRRLFGTTSSLYGFDRTKVRFASNRRTSLIIGPEGVVPSMLPEAIKRNADRAAKNKGHEFDSHENRPLQERCILMSQESYSHDPRSQRQQSAADCARDGMGGLLHEINHHHARHPHRRAPHIPQGIRQWQGESVGRWEGNTLVSTPPISRGGAPFQGSSEKLHLVERFTRVSDDMIIYQFTVEDPTTWAKPWTAEIPMTKTEGPVYEWACHEGNNMISNILRGARVAEREAAQNERSRKGVSMREQGFWLSLTGVGLLLAAVRRRGLIMRLRRNSTTTPIKVRGTVTKWELTNPHSWIHIDVKGPDGKVATWTIEGASPNNLSTDSA